jgi:serine/threonine protein kinase
MIADKVLSSLEFLHYKNFVHRDVQPGNFLVGLGKKLQQIYTIDYAFATPYQDPMLNRHRPDSPLPPDSFCGTLRFASLNVLRGHRHSRRDDL